MKPARCGISHRLANPGVVATTTVFSVAVLAQTSGAVVQLLERVLRSAIEQLAIFREQQRAGAALEQLDSEVLLELLNLAAHGRLGQMQLGRGLRER